MSSLLKTSALTVKVADILVCRDLGLTVEPGDKWGILGINGVGKTTLLHTLAGLRQPVNGEISYGGTSLDKLSTRQRAQFRSVLFQDMSDPFPATVMESVLVGRHPFIGHWQWESSQDIAIAERNISELELQDRKQQLVSTLSGGERQRVAIATLLSQQAPLMLLDEPTNHLDLKRQMEVMQRFSNLVDNGKVATVMILHDLNLVSRFCNKILMLFGDGQFRQGNCSELLRAELLNNLYGYPISKISQNGQSVFVPG